jgi:hypothetical protein
LQGFSLEVGILGDTEPIFSPLHALLQYQATQPRAEHYTKEGHGEDAFIKVLLFQACVLTRWWMNWTKSVVWKDQV